jgi:hypothetical protein
MIQFPKVDYDGLYFLPHEDDNGTGMKFSLFELKDEDKGIPIDGTTIGACFHLIFFKEDDDGYPELEDNFEAILADPLVYVQNLIGGTSYGCILRKTDKSGKWIDDYLKRVGQHSIMVKLRDYAQQITESK